MIQIVEFSLLAPFLRTKRGFLGKKCGRFVFILKSLIFIQPWWLGLLENQLSLSVDRCTLGKPWIQSRLGLLYGVLLIVDFGAYL